jgi:hypothetical protein
VTAADLDFDQPDAAPKPRPLPTSARPGGLVQRIGELTDQLLTLEIENARGRLDITHARITADVLGDLVSDIYARLGAG